MIRRTQIIATASGSTGSATGSASSSVPINGKVLAVYLDVSAAAAATLDVTLAEANQSPALPVISVANLTADAWYYPRVPAASVVDGSAITNSHDHCVVADHLSLSVAEADSGDSVTATIVWYES